MHDIDTLRFETSRKLRNWR